MKRMARIILAALLLLCWGNRVGAESQHSSFHCSLKKVGDRRAFAMQYNEEASLFKFICADDREYFVRTPCGRNSKLIFSVVPIANTERDIGGWPTFFYFYPSTTLSVALSISCPT